jgi:hypothetical protein
VPEPKEAGVIADSLPVAQVAMGGPAGADSIGRHLDAMPFSIKQPTVKRTAKAAVLTASQGKSRSTMRTTVIEAHRSAVGVVE